MFWGRNFWKSVKQATMVFYRANNAASFYSKSSPSNNSTRDNAIAGVSNSTLDNNGTSGNACITANGNHGICNFGNDSAFQSDAPGTNSTWNNIGFPRNSWNYSNGDASTSRDDVASVGFKSTSYSLREAEGGQYCEKQRGKCRRLFAARLTPSPLSVQP